MTSLRLLTITLLAVAFCFGQKNPPPEVDKALRDRVAKYFQAHVDGKYRQAEQYIAEENKDEFYNSAKTAYLNFTDSTVDYTDDYTKATVHTPTEMLWKVPQLGEMKLKKIVESYWKVVDGQWYWYQDSGNRGMIVPFGPDGKPIRMNPGPNADAPKPETVADRIKNFDRGSLANIEVNRTQIHLSKAGGVGEEILVKNNLPGVVVVQVDHTDLPGMDVSINPSQVKPGESAKVTFTYHPPKPEDKPEMNASVRIQPTQQLFPLAITFTEPVAAPAPAPAPAPAAPAKTKATKKTKK